MSKPMDERIRRMIALHDRGVITQLELCSHLADCAVDPDFFHHLDLVPDSVLGRLRKLAERAPAHPEDCFFVDTSDPGPEFDYEAHDRQRRETHYWGVRRLREHFYPNEPLPVFEPIKLAGLVDEVMEVNGVIVIFGDIATWMIRNNPIHLVTPNGIRIITSVSKMAHIKRDGDALSPDAITRRFGRYGLFLADQVRSTSDTPLQTEVWVDRTAVARLPDAPRS